MRAQWCLVAVAVVVCICASTATAEGTHRQYSTSKYTLAVKEAFGRLRHVREKLKRAKFELFQAKSKTTPLFKGVRHAKHRASLSLAKYRHYKKVADAAWKVLSGKTHALKTFRTTVLSPAQAAHEAIVKEALAMSDLKKAITALKEKSRTNPSVRSELSAKTLKLTEWEARKNRTDKAYADAKKQLNSLIHSIHKANEAKNRAVADTDTAHAHHTQMIQLEVKAVNTLAQAVQNVVLAERRVTRYRLQRKDAIRKVKEALSIRAATFGHRVTLAKTRYMQASKAYYRVSNALPGKRNKLKALKKALEPLPEKLRVARTQYQKNLGDYVDAARVHKKAQDKFLYWTMREGHARGALMRFVGTHGWGKPLLPKPATKPATTATPSKPTPKKN